MILRRKKPQHARRTHLLLASKGRGKTHRMFVEAVAATVAGAEVRVWGPRGWPGVTSVPHFPDFVRQLEGDPPRGGVVIVDAADYLWTNTPMQVTEPRPLLERISQLSCEQDFTLLVTASHPSPYLDALLPSTSSVTFSSDLISGPAANASLHMVAKWKPKGEARAPAGKAPPGGVAVFSFESDPAWAGIETSRLADLMDAHGVTAEELAAFCRPLDPTIQTGPRSATGVSLETVARILEWSRLADMPTKRKVLLDGAGFDPAEAVTQEVQNYSDNELRLLAGYRAAQGQ